MTARFTQYKQTNGDHRWRVVAGNGKKMAGSLEGYRRPGKMKEAAIAAATAILRSLAPERLAPSIDGVYPVAGDRYLVSTSDFAGKAMRFTLPDAKP